VINPITVGRDELLETISCLDILLSAQEDLGIDFFIIGAAARDLILKHAYGQTPFRATGNVDIAVSVKDWEEYHRIINYFESVHGMTKIPDVLRVKKDLISIDILPFGEIANEVGQLIYPGGSTVWSVIGFEEVNEATVTILVSGKDEIKVASLPGVVILKMIAWSENPHNRPQDPIDICMVMMAYHDIVGNELFTSHVDLIDDTFEFRTTGSRILGRHMADLLGKSEWKNVVLSLLQKALESDPSDLVVKMGNQCQEDYSVRLACLRALLMGFEEMTH